ncbi:MAG: hypothetical protein ACR2HE_04650 [Casimicrobiaceae bacterium]
MAWLVLGVAGLFEVAWAIGPATVLRLACIALIVAGIAGLQLVTV